MKVYLVRHGETPSNVVRVFQVPEAPLSERGARQAERVAQRLADAGIETILTSDYVRAHATAQAIGAASGAPVRVEPLLRERNFGIHRGRPYDALDVDVLAPHYVPPDGESVPAFEARVGKAWAAVRDLAARARGSIVVVSHGLFCRTIARGHLIPPAGIDVGSAQWANTSVTEIVAEPGPKWRIARLACTAHLDGLESLPPSSMRFA